MQRLNSFKDVWRLNFIIQNFRALEFVSQLELCVCLVRLVFSTFSLVLFKLLLWPSIWIRPLWNTQAIFLLCVIVVCQLYYIHYIFSLFKWTATIFFFQFWTLCLELRLINLLYILLFVIIKCSLCFNKCTSFII